VREGGKDGGGINGEFFFCRIDRVSIDVKN